MNVLFLSPGFPVEMPFFVRGLAEVGARVVGLGDQPEGMLAPPVRAALHRYVRVESLWDEQRLVEDARRVARETPIDRVECLWEPGVTVAARLREALGLPGMGVEQALRFRDKERMKRALDAAGIRTPRHARADSEAACREAAQAIGYPLVVKPIAGAGSADTYRVDGPDDLERVLPRVRHVPELSVEEFISGEEFTFETIASEGRILHHSVSWYRPPPLIGRSVEWISPQTVTLREPDAPALAAGVTLGRAVLGALGFRTGFTHMEWFRTHAGEAVFGEIAARPPGALSVDLMNFACDVDTYRGWAEAVCHGRFSQPVERRYNAAVVFKRARGSGRITRIEGLERLVARHRPWIVRVDLLPPGAARRDWKKTLLSDGHVIVRHPDLQALLEIADRFGTDLQLHAAEA
jgi:biotin carboxylase